MTYSTSNILPPTSLRDVISLILIINSLPSYINAIILILYTLSGSTKFIGGKLFLKYVSLKNKQFEDSWYLNSHINYSKVIYSFINLSVIGSIILLLIVGIFNETFLHNIDLLAKTILATELIGSTTNSITSIISSNPNNHAKINYQHKDLNYQMLNNSFLRIVCCFTIILFINSINNNINFKIIFNYLKLNDFKSIFSYKILSSSSSSSFNNNHYVDRLSSLKIRNLDLTTILNFIYYELCINVITIKLNSLFLLIGFKSLSNNLDQLNSLNPNIPVDFKRPRLKEEFLHEDSSSPIPIISLKHTSHSNSMININNNGNSNNSSSSSNTNATNNNKLKFVNISLPKAIANSKCNFRIYNSISAKNFETFVYKLFSSNHSNSHSNISVTGNTSINHTNNNNGTNMMMISNGSTTSLNGSTNNGLHPHNAPLKLSKNSTIIIDKNDSIMQPFWSLLAVVKVMIKNSNLFQGKITRWKNNKDQFLLNFSLVNKLLISVKFIDDTKILLKINETNKDFSNLNIKLNGINWEYFKIIENHIFIYALSPNFQYEIEILNEKNQILNNLLVNTISTSENIILRESPNISSILTIKLSLISTLESLNQTKNQLKDFRKDENKRQSEVKKNNEILKERISKNKLTNELNLKKLKGLNQSIHQYENDMIHLKDEIEELKKEINKQEILESELLSQIAEIKKFIDTYNDSIVEFKLNLQSIEIEESNALNKLEKSINKVNESEADIENLNDNINNLKDSIILQLKKKSNLINDKFDTILLKVKNENERILNEIEKLTK